MPDPVMFQSDSNDHSISFLSHQRKLELGLSGAEAFSARFSLSAFHPGLFTENGISCPDRICRSVKKRQAEFLAGRALARTALARLGLKDAPIPIGDDRAPVWPMGSVGSISHAHGRCAVVAILDPSLMVGLDIETLASGSTLASILQVTMNDTERSLIETQGVMASDWLATLAFSAKETLYKALYPTVQRFFGFDCAELAEPPTEDQLTLRLTTQLHPSLPEDTCFAIRYITRPNYVLTWLIRPVPTG